MPKSLQSLVGTTVIMLFNMAVLAFLGAWLYEQIPHIMTRMIVVMLLATGSVRFMLTDLERKFPRIWMRVFTHLSMVLYLVSIGMWAVTGAQSMLPAYVALVLLVPLVFAVRNDAPESA